MQASLASQNASLAMRRQLLEQREIVSFSAERLERRLIECYDVACLNLSICYCEALSEVPMESIRILAVSKRGLSAS